MLDSLVTSIAELTNWAILETYGWRLAAGLQVTIQIVVISCSLGFVLAYPLCKARLSKNWLISGLASAYVAFFRGTPLLCQLYIIYYGAGELRPQLEAVGLWRFFREAYVCCLIAFTLNTTAYQAEIIRGAITSVPKGQVEAAKALGLSRFRIARHVVWPQALVVALPPLGNELIGIIKASALAAIITILDLMGQTRLICARSFDFSIYVYTAIIYLLITEGIRRAWSSMDARLRRHATWRPTG